MAKGTYSTDTITIRKTRLSDSDLILTFITSDRGLVRAVAKSARRPGNTFSNRLDLFNVGRVTCAKCKNLDIIRECRLVETFPNIRESFELQSIASSIVELVWRCTFDGNVNDNLFDFLIKTLEFLESESCNPYMLQSAAIIKLLAMEGLCPTLNKCAKCGTSIQLDRSENLQFSYSEGGVLCKKCASCCSENIDNISTQIANTLLFELVSTYEELSQEESLNSQNFAKIMHILDRWIVYHVGYKLKSLANVRA